MNVQAAVDPEFEALVTAEWLETLIKRVVETHFNDQSAQISIALDDDAAVHELNLQYREVDSTTDVLSFEGGYQDPESGFFHLGDIIISVPQTQKQAITAGHPFKHELALLTVHGILHLRGFDHAEPQEKALMWQEQDNILKEIEDLLSE
jgi:probable rRNA maturation factor